MEREIKKEGNENHKNDSMGGRIIGIILPLIIVMHIMPDLNLLLLVALVAIGGFIGSRVPSLFKSFK